MISTKNRAPELFRPFQVGHYGQLGAGASRLTLSRDLLSFSKIQKKKSSAYLGLLAFFEDDDFFADEFEAALWRELSFLTDIEESSAFNIVDAIADPVNDGFRFNFAGTNFFVKRFCPVNQINSAVISQPALVFKLLSQLEMRSDIFVVKYDLPIH